MKLLVDFLVVAVSLAIRDPGKDMKQINMVILKQKEEHIPQCLFLPFSHLQNCLSLNDRDVSLALQFSEVLQHLQDQDGDLGVLHPYLMKIWPGHQILV